MAGMTFQQLQRETITFLLRRLYGYVHPEPTIVNLRKVGLIEEYNRILKILRKQVGKKNLDMVQLLKQANLSLDNVQRFAAVLTEKQKIILKGKIDSVLAIQDVDIRNKAISTLTTEILTTGMKVVTEGKRVWNVDNWLRREIINRRQKLYQDMSFQAANEVGITTFRVTQHGGAREKCYPWQNKILDFSGPTRNEFVVGIMYNIININETSYGEPDGLRGVNCRHVLIPFIPGLNRLKDPDIDIGYNERIAKAESLLRTQQSRMRNLQTQKYYRDLNGEDVTRYDLLISNADNEIIRICKRYDLSRNRSLERAYK